MPVVRPYPIGEVQGQPLPNVTPNVAAAGDIASFGGNQARDLQQAGQNLGQASDTTFSIYERAAKEANESRVQDFNNQFILGQQEILRTGPDAYYKLKGGDAIQGAGAVTERLAKLKQQLLGQAANPYQRERLGPILDAHFASATDQIACHVDQQQQVYDKNVALASQDIAEREALSNPDNLGGAMTRAADAARVLYKGQAPEVIENEARQAASRVVSSLIKDRLIRNDPAAVGLYRKYESSLDPKDRAALSAAVEMLSNTVGAKDWYASNSAAPTTEVMKKRVADGIDFWEKDGYGRHVGAGIIANFLRESGFRTDNPNRGDGADGSDSIGIAHWNSGRAEALKRFVTANGGNFHDINTQLKFAKSEIDANPALKAKLMAAKTAAEAATIFTREFEQPKYANVRAAERARTADKILAENPGGASGGTGDQALDAVNKATGMAGPAARPTTGDPALDAVNAATGMGIGAVPAASADARPHQEGVVDYRRQMIDAEQRRITLTQQNEREFANDPARLRANQAVIETEYAKSKAIAQMGKDQLYASLQDYMAKGGPGGGPAVEMPPAMIMSQLTYEQQNSVERQINRNVEGKKTKTDMSVWYEIDQGLTSDNANVRETWAGTNLMQFKEFLADDVFKDLANKQGIVRKGEAKELGYSQMINQVVNDALLGNGIDPTPKADSSPTSDAAKAAKFHRAFHAELKILEDNKGKMATRAEAEGIADGLVKTAVKGGWFSRDIPVFLLEPADVPAAHRAAIIGVIRASGGIPTEERVLELYRHQRTMEPRQTEIPLPAPTARRGESEMSLQVAATRRMAASEPRFPRASLPPRATPRVIDNPPDPAPPPLPGGTSVLAEDDDLNAHDATVRRMRQRLGLE